MPPRLLSALGVVCLGFALIPPCRGEPPAAPDAKASKAGQSRRTDLQGDPLPTGALDRLGTVRFRPLSGGGSSPYIAFSPDGKTLVCGGAEGVCLWDAATGERLAWLSETFPAFTACFSPDGQTLIAGDAAGTIRRWQAGTGKRLQEIQQPPDPNFRGMVGFLSADGKTLGAASSMGEVRLWDVATGKRILRWQPKGRSSWPYAALSPDGKLLAVRGERNLIHLIDPATGEEVRRVEEPNTNTGKAEEVGWLVFSPDGRLLAGAAKDSLCIWDVATGKLRHQIKAKHGRLTYSPDGKYLACGDAEGLRLYEIASGKEVSRLEQSAGFYEAAAFSPDGQMLAGLSLYTIRLWNVATGKRCRRVPGHDHPISCLAFSPDGASLTSGERGGDGELLVWDVATRKPRHSFPGHFPGVVSLAYSPDGQTLAAGDGYGSIESGGLEAKIHLWDLRRGQLRREFFAHINSVKSLAFSPDGKTLASAGHDARAKLWDAATGRRLHQIRGADSVPKTVSFSPDGQALLVAGTADELAIWEPKSGRKVRDVGPADDNSRAVFQAVFLSDGQTIFSCESGDYGRAAHEARFWDRASGRLLRSFPMGTKDTSGRMSYALSPDGKTLAASNGDFNNPAVLLWDADTGQLLTKLRGHSGGLVTAVAFSPDSRVLASGGQDTTVLLWDVGRARLEHLWAALAANGDSAQAIKRLAAKPKEAIPFLKERLHRAAEAEQRANSLIADLDSDQFQVRERASRELAKLGPDAAFALRDALQGEPSAEVSRRIQTILDKMKRPGEETVGSDPRSVWLSLAVLEEIGTSEARQVLEGLAKGPETSRIARQARAALTRLSKRRSIR